MFWGSEGIGGWSLTSAAAGELSPNPISQMTQSQLLELLEDHPRWGTLSAEEQLLAKQRYIEIQRDEYLHERRLAAERLRQEATAHRAAAMEEELKQRREVIRSEWDDAWEIERASMEEAELLMQADKLEEASSSGGFFSNLLALVLVAPSLLWLIQLLFDAANGDRWVTWPDALAYSLGFGKPPEQAIFCEQLAWACSSDQALHWYVSAAFLISVFFLAVGLMSLGASTKNAES